jgi:hypothetical protein
VDCDGPGDEMRRLSLGKRQDIVTKTRHVRLFNSTEILRNSEIVITVARMAQVGNFYQLLA